MPVPKHIKNKKINVITSNLSKSEEKDPFAEALPPKEFMKEIRAIKKSSDAGDIALRKGASTYMKSLHCI